LLLSIIIFPLLIISLFKSLGNHNADSGKVYQATKKRVLDGPQSPSTVADGNLQSSGISALNDSDTPIITNDNLEALDTPEKVVVVAQDDPSLPLTQQARRLASENGLGVPDTRAAEQQFMNVNNLSNVERGIADDINNGVIEKGKPGEREMILQTKITSEISQNAITLM
jgi:hypothetical protein